MLKHALLFSALAATLFAQKATIVSSTGYPSFSQQINGAPFAQVQSVAPVNGTDACTQGKDIWVNSATSPVSVYLCDTTGSPTGSHWTGPYLSADLTKNGSILLTGITSGSVGISVADAAGTAITYLLPSGGSGAGKMLVDSGSVTCPTNLPTSMPSTCHQMVWRSTVICSGWSTGATNTLSTDGATYSTFNSTNIGTTETAFGSTCTIPANTITTGTVIRFQFPIIMSTSASSVPTVGYNLRLTNASGTLLVNGGSVTPTASFTYRGQMLSIVCMGTGTPAAGRQISCFADSNQVNIGTTTSQMGFGALMNTTAAIQAAADTSTDLTFVLTAKFGTSTAGNMLQMPAMFANVFGPNN